MSQNWSRYWRPQEQCPRQGSYSLIRKLDDSYAKMDLEQEKDGFEWPNRGFGNQDTFEGPLTGEWVTGGLRTPQTKAKVFSLGREGIPETEKGESACRALGSKRWNRNEGEFNGLGGQYPFLSSYPRTIAVIS